MALSATAAAVAAPPDSAPPTYFNDGTPRGADPYVLYDRRSGYYYAYSTEGADRGFYFGIYRSPDLATWEHVPGGALPVKDPRQWAHDWFWAPEVYHNEKTGIYFMFYAGRMNTRIAENFEDPDFAQACKIGVAVAKSPVGPFHNIAASPIDYFPYDPAYRDINGLLGDGGMRPPATQQTGERVPLGTYLPSIDPDVCFDRDGRIYLYFSRNAYRDWVWDTDLGKYLEEARIYAVELDSGWWRDPRGATMPRIAGSYRNANRGPHDLAGSRRKDGFTPIIDYDSDKQSWENAHVDDYANSGGRKKDRRWEEGSTTFRVENPNGPPVYLLTYSANNFENQYYGVGYAFAASPLGPWRKSPANPVLSRNPAIGLYSPGHGCVIDSPDGKEHFYVHHGRHSLEGPRYLYTEELRFSGGPSPKLEILSSPRDRPLPSGVTPITVRASQPELRLRSGQSATLAVSVTSAAGASFSLAHPLNRLRAVIVPESAGQAVVSGNQVTVTKSESGAARLRVYYQRKRADGTYFDVVNPDDRRPAADIPLVGGP